MAETIDRAGSEAGTDTLLVACPADGALNRVARAKLGEARDAANAAARCSRAGRPDSPPPISSGTP